MNETIFKKPYFFFQKLRKQLKFDTYKQFK